MKIGINCGHTISGAGYGATGIIKESEHTRLVGYALMDKLKKSGVEVIDCTVDKADTQTAYLKKSVEIANDSNVDLFISIHFNASKEHMAGGTEVYTYNGAKHQEAVNICQNLSNLGFNNRGVKNGSELYVVKYTKAKAILIEVCFCDNEQDVKTYLTCGEDKIAQAILNSLEINQNDLKSSTSVAENYNMTHDEFIEFVGGIASKDWKERHLILPSLVVAQAIKESAWGKSELAQNANALFGIKKNGWTGKTYFKDATEQNPDGTYRKDKNTEWRAYDSWEQSIIDHNDYLATRKIGSQTEPNWKDLIGCENYILAVQHLQGAQFPYATSLTYEESLVNDYIEKYNLTRFDGVSYETPVEKPIDDAAPDGMLYVVQVGAYKSKKNAEDFVKRLESMGVISMVKLYQAE